jgi:hypothetical protein
LKMNTTSKISALMLGAALAAGLAGCKKQAEDTVPAPVTAPNTTTPTPPAATPTTPPADTTTPPPDTTAPPATGTTPGAGGTSGTSGTQGTTGTGQPPSTAPDKTDQKDAQRDRRPTY